MEKMILNRNPRSKPKIQRWPSEFANPPIFVSDYELGEERSVKILTCASLIINIPGPWATHGSRRSGRDKNGWAGENHGHLQTR